MAGIFICYRHEDSMPYAGRLAADLGSLLPGVSIFQDNQRIKPGEDFLDATSRALDQTGVCLVLIGRTWLTATDRAGQKRLIDPEDPVVLEVAAALKRDIRTIPILVGRAAMPPIAELPGLIGRFARLQAYELRDAEWRDDVERLAKIIGVSLDVAPPASPSPARDKQPPPSDAVSFDIVKGFTLREGEDGLKAKVLEVLDNISSRSHPAFTVECSWVAEVEEQIRLLKEKASTEARAERDLLRLTRLRKELRAKTESMRWAFNVLFTHPDLHAAITRLGYHLNEKMYAECITGMLENENGTASGLDFTWYLFPATAGEQEPYLELKLSAEEATHMEDGFYRDDQAPRQRGLEEGKAYSLGYFSPGIFSRRSMAQLLCYLANLPQERLQPAGLSRLLDLRRWAFAKCSPGHVILYDERLVRT